MKRRSRDRQRVEHDRRRSRRRRAARGPPSLPIRPACPGEPDVAVVLPAFHPRNLLRTALITSSTSSMPNMRAARDRHPTPATTARPTCTSRPSTVSASTSEASALRRRAMPRRCGRGRRYGASDRVPYPPAVERHDLRPQHDESQHRREHVRHRVAEREGRHVPADRASRAERRRRPSRWPRRRSRVPVCGCPGSRRTCRVINWNAREEGQPDREPLQGACDQARIGRVSLAVSSSRDTIGPASTRNAKAAGTITTTVSRSPRRSDRVRPRDRRRSTVRAIAGSNAVKIETAKIECGNRKMMNAVA